MKRYKNRNSNAGTEATNASPKTSFPSNDQVTFGNSFSNNGNYSRSSQPSNGTNGGNGGNDRHKSNGRNMSLNGLGNEELGIIKNNPLLKHYPSLGDSSGFTSDMSNSNSNSECDDERAINHEIMKNVSISKGVIVIPGYTCSTELAFSGAILMIVLFFFRCLIFLTIQIHNGLIETAQIVDRVQHKKPNVCPKQMFPL